MKKRSLISMLVVMAMLVTTFASMFAIGVNAAAATQPYMKINKKMVGDRNTCFPVFLNEPSFSKVLFKDDKGEISNFYDGNHRVAGCNFMDKTVLAELISMYENK